MTCFLLKVNHALHMYIFFFFPKQLKMNGCHGVFCISLHKLDSVTSDCEEETLEKKTVKRDDLPVLLRNS